MDGWLYDDRVMIALTVIILAVFAAVTAWALRQGADDE
jgi:hypothetical protein